jgi:hypothetical protein
MRCETRVYSDTELGRSFINRCYWALLAISREPPSSSLPHRSARRRHRRQLPEHASEPRPAWLLTVQLHQNSLSSDSDVRTPSPSPHDLPEAQPQRERREFATSPPSPATARKTPHHPYPCPHPSTCRGLGQQQMQEAKECEAGMKQHLLEARELCEMW